MRFNIKAGLMEYRTYIKVSGAIVCQGTNVIIIVYVHVRKHLGKECFKIGKRLISYVMYVCGKIASYRQNDKCEIRHI